MQYGQTYLQGLVHGYSYRTHSLHRQATFDSAFYRYQAYILRQDYRRAYSKPHVRQDRQNRGRAFAFRV